MPLFNTAAALSSRSLGMTSGGLSLTSVFDNFNRSNSSSLGFTSDGKAQWSVLSGSFSISSNTAVGSGSSGVAVIDFGSSNVSAGLSLSWGGDALYFRVVDANNWWRVGTYLDQISYSVPYVYYTYPWTTGRYPVSVTGGAYGCSPSVHGGTANSTVNPTSTSAPAGFCLSPEPHSHTIYFPGCSNPTGGSPLTIDIPNYPHDHGAFCSPGGTVTNYGVNSGVENYYYVVLEKCVGGSITTVQTTNSTYAYTYTSVQVTANGSSITVKYNGTANDLFSNTSDSTHSTATKHGIGRRNPVDASSSSMDNFSVSRL